MSIEEYYIEFERIPKSLIISKPRKRVLKSEKNQNITAAVLPFRNINFNQYTRILHLIEFNAPKSIFLDLYFQALRLQVVRRQIDGLIIFESCVTCWCRENFVFDLQSKIKFRRDKLQAAHIVIVKSNYLHIDRKKGLYCITRNRGFICEFCIKWIQQFMVMYPALKLSYKRS